MGRTVSIGAQDFEALRERGYFYVDKTSFVREWWQPGDVVTISSAESLHPTGPTRAATAS